MAGLTSTFPFKPFLPITKPPPPLSLSFASKLFQLHLCNPTLLYNSDSRFSSLRSSISARSGSRSGPGDSDGSPEDDKALNISRIRSATVRVIDQRQNMLGVLPKSEAIQMAEDAELDLVILSPDAEPPVVRIMDYSKYLYELEKKKRDQQKKSAAGRMDLKELKMGYNIDVHDYSVRLKAAQKFLKEGNKIKVIVNLKGRQNLFRNNAIELIRRFRDDIGKLAIEEGHNFRERNIYMFLVPNKAVLQKAQEPPKKMENSEVINEVSAGV